MMQGDYFKSLRDNNLKKTETVENCGLWVFKLNWINFFFFDEKTETVENCGLWVFKLNWIIFFFLMKKLRL